MKRVSAGIKGDLGKYACHRHGTEVGKLLDGLNQLLSVEQRVILTGAHCLNKNVTERCSP
jgi:hypothetical protein